MKKKHEYYMKQALQLAQEAYESGEVPIGAIVVSNSEIIGKGYNQVERLKDATVHAEMVAITAASNFLNSKYLKECTLYVTLEPCLMCGGAIEWSQIPEIVYGAKDFKKGIISKHQIKLEKNKKIIEGVLEKESRSLLQKFFNELRNPF